MGGWQSLKALGAFNSNVEFKSQRPIEEPGKGIDLCVWDKTWVNTPTPISFSLKIDLKIFFQGDIFESAVILGFPAW